MSMYKRCKRIAENELQTEDVHLSLPALEPDRPTFPPAITDSPDYISKWYCKHVFYISDIHLVHKIARKFKKSASDDQIVRYIKKIAKELISKQLIENASSNREIFILFGGDISSDFEVSKIFYTEFMKHCKQELVSRNRTRCHVYAVLGNHEYWGFSKFTSCNEMYQNLFDSLGIRFLNNTMSWFGERRVPTKIIRNEKGFFQELAVLKREENEEEYDHQMLRLHNVLIVGGVGFAGYNQKFNADMGLYQEALDREEEVRQTCKWLETYSLALKHAKETGSLLIVLTHNPLCDWKADSSTEQNCVYFSGHNHRNYIFHDDECNTHTFADNQIGYHASGMQLKEAFIYDRFNPFAAYADGYHEVKSCDYLKFYDFMNESIQGNGHVEKLLSTQNARFYMIKHKGFYGFFVVSSNASYICAGGNVKRIGSCTDITRYDKEFLRMIQKYLKILSPYRNAQEQISKAVRSFGGDGTIHGCIIDIDTYNHIMLNPNDGCITYYYSPVMGLVEPHDNLLSLLDKHNKLLAAQYRKQLADTDCSLFVPDMHNDDRLIKIDIKNSLYNVSGRMNQLQRLFNRKILRDWNEELLLKDEVLELLF